MAGGRDLWWDRPRGTIPSTISCLLVLVLAASSLAGAATPWQVSDETWASVPQASTEVAADCAIHTPILIEGDVGPLGFILGHHPITGAPIERPGSGVTGGTGTEEDPYRISGWCIQNLLPVAATDAITIRGSNAHVIIEANHLTGFSYGIFFDGVSNIQVVQNRLTGHQSAGIRADASEDIGIMKNHFDRNLHGVSLRASERVMVNENEFLDHMTALRCHGSRDISVALNQFTQSRYYHVALDQCHDLTFSDNHFKGLTQQTFPFFDFGVIAERSDRVVVHRNSFTSLGAGAYFVLSKDASIIDNTFVETFNDLVVGGSTGFHVSGNEMVNGIGLVGLDLAEMLHEIDASNTVRGAPVFYRHGVQDLTVPSGVGQVIIAGASNVTIEAQSIHDVHPAIQLSFSDHVTVQQNDLTGRSGIQMYGVQDAQVANNTIGSLLLFDSMQNTIVHNDVHGGIILFMASDNLIHRNSISGPGFTGVADAFGSGNTIHDNDIWGHGGDPSGGGGVVALGLTEPLDARHNWWGCPDGPAHPDCADVSGKVAYVPWRTEPNPVAGRQQ